MKKALALVALTVTALAWAQSNVPTLITLSDGTVVTVQLPVAWDATLVRVAGWLATIVGIARFVLKFLPAADDGNNAPLAKIVHVLKHISLAIPDRHVQPGLSTTGKTIGTNVATSTGKSIVGAILIGLLVLPACRAQSNNSIIAATATQITNAPAPLISLPKVVLGSGTNWMSSVMSKMDLSGVYIVTFKGGKTALDRGGFTTDYVPNEYDWNNALRFRPGVCVTLPADLSVVYAGLGCVVGIIPNGKLETWLNHAPVFEIIAKTVKWSELYGFGEVGSQFDQWNPQVAFGGGVKIW